MACIIDSPIHGNTDTCILCNEVSVHEGTASNSVLAHRFSVERENRHVQVHRFRPTYL